MNILLLNAGSSGLKATFMASAEGSVATREDVTMLREVIQVLGGTR